MLKTLMGDHAVTRQFKTRTDRFDFVEVKGSAAPFFKRVVRDHEFDVAEMAIMTYVIAKSFGTPYRLLPFAVLARFQHPFLVYNAGYYLPFGGGSPGPRFLIPMLPFLAVPLGLALRRYPAVTVALGEPTTFTVKSAPIPVKATLCGWAPFAATPRDAMRDPAAAIAIGERARARVVEKFSLAAEANTIAAVYKTLV